jgi:hypothetical protein
MSRTVYLHEFTITKPNLIRFDIRDGDLLSLGIVEIESPDSGASYSAWYSDADGRYQIKGLNKDYKRYEDKPPESFLDRAAADDETNWSITGGINIDAVHRWTSPQDNGIWSGDSGGDVGTKITVMRHYLWLELDADLVNDTEYTVTFPTELGLRDYTFTYRDKAIRCSAIAVDQIGYGEQDSAKIAYLVEWVPGYGTKGAVQFSGLTDWHIMDRNGNIVWSAGAAPVSRLAPTDSELTRISMQDADRRLTDTSVAPRLITGFTNANPCVVTYTGANLSNDMVITIEDLRSLSGSTDSESELNSQYYKVGDNTATGGAYWWVIKNVNNAGPKTFQLYKENGTTAYDRSANTDTYLTGGKIYETYTLDNRYGTYVYELDFSAFEPGEPGIYYIYIEGLGISYPFHIDNGTWHKKASIFAAGDYHWRHDTDHDGRFGYTMPAGIRAGTANNTVYNSLVPLFFTDEWGNQGFGSDDTCGGFIATSYLNSAFIQRNGDGAEVADFGGLGHHDAGDPDSRIVVHSRIYHGMMDAYDFHKSACETTNFNIPKVEELYPSDTIYAGTSVLPDNMQSALWAMRSWLQGVDELGQARGGTNYGNPSEQTPVFLNRSPDPIQRTMYNYGPDHASGILIAWILAKMAIALRKHGSFETLAQYFEDKAVLVWDRNTLIGDNGSQWGSHSSGAVETARLEMYGDYKTACENTTNNSVILPYDGASSIGSFNGTITGGTSGATATLYLPRTVSILPFDNASGMLAGTITGGSSGATATIHSVNASGAPILYIYGITGAFTDNETITASGGGTALVNNPTNPALSTTYLAAKAGGLYIHNVTGTFQDNETVTSSGGGSVVVNNPGNPALKGVFAYRFDQVQVPTSLPNASFLWRQATCATTMYRMTGDDEYNDIIVDYWNSVASGNKDTIARLSFFPAGMWEYVNCTHPNVDATIKADWRSRMLTNGTSRVVNTNLSGVGVRALKEYSSSALFGADGTDWSNVQNIIRNAIAIAAEDSPGDVETYKKQVMYGFNYVFGANALKRSLVYSSGIDPPGSALHNNSLACGLPPPIGSCILGTSGRNFTGTLLWASHQPLHWLTKNNNPSYTDNYTQERAVYPSTDSWPSAMYFINVYGALEQNENVIAGTMGPQYWLATVMYALNGNGQTTLSTDVPAGKTRARAKTSATLLDDLALTPDGPYYASGSFYVDTDDTDVFVVATTSATPPTVAQIVAGQDHTGSAAVDTASVTVDEAGTSTFEFTSLTANTLHHVYATTRDASNVLGPIVSTTVTTAELIAFAYTYREGDTDGTDTDTYNFTKAGAHYAIGTANSQRKVLVDVYGRLSGSSTAIIPSSVTVKPVGQSNVTATLVKGLQFTGATTGTNFVGTYEALVPLGTEIDVDIVWNTAISRMGIDIVTVSGSKAVTASYSASAQSPSPAQVSITPVIPTNGVAHLAVLGVGAGVANATWTNATEESGSDTNVELTSVRKAAAQRATAGSTAVTVAMASGIDFGIVAAVYEPY